MEAKKNPENPSEPLDLNDIPDNIEGIEDDPELLKIKQEYEANKLKSGIHQRENTIDIEKRLEQEILAMESGQTAGTGEEKAHNSGSPAQNLAPKSVFEENPELFTIYKDIDEKYKSEMDELWSKYVEDIAKTQEDGPKTPISADFAAVHAAILSNPFLRKMIKPEEFKGKDLTYSKLPTSNGEEYKLPRCFLYDLLLENYHMHSSVVPDYAIRKMLIENEAILKSTKDPKKLFEANISLGRIYFMLENYTESENKFKEAQKIMPKNKETLYWMGILYFYAFREEQNEKQKIEKIKLAETLLLEYFASRMKEKTKDITDIMILWCLLILTLELQTTLAKLKIKPKNKAEAYSCEIKRIDEYLGYIAWTEKYTYSNVKSQIDDCKDVLRELIGKYPTRPEAYLKLWKKLYDTQKIDEAIDISEQLFIEGTDYEENDLVNVIVLVYSKSLMKGKHEIIAFQKLQYQYTIQTDMPILLYFYGKYIAQCENEKLRKHFLGSALSSLQECIRSCMPQRHIRVYYWMGKIYEKRRDIVNALFCYGKALSGFPKNSDKSKEISKYLDQYKEFLNKYYCQIIEK